MIQVNTGNLRYGASRFSGGAADLRMRAGRLKNAATQLGGRWSGEASRAFFQAVEIVLRDLDKAAGFLEQANTAMNQLAWTMEQVERIRQQIQNLEWELSSLSGEEHQHERSQVRSHIRQLQLQADTESNQADYTAAQAFHRILGDLHSLHFYDPDKSWWQEALDGLKTGWKAVKGFGDGVEEAIVDTVVGITDAIVHLDKTMEGIGNLVLHPIDSGSAIWQQVTDSWERDVTNGDAYSGGKWWGNAVGQIVLSLAGTKGADKVAKGLKAAQAGEVVEEAAVAAKASDIGTVGEKQLSDASIFSKEKLNSSLGPSFRSGLDDLLKKHASDMSLTDFERLKNAPLQESWTDIEGQSLVKRVRSEVQLQKGVVMQKILGRNTVEGYLTKDWDTVGGFTARYQDVAHLDTPAKIKEELRLDYSRRWDPHHPENPNPHFEGYQNPYLNEKDEFIEGPVYALRYRCNDISKYSVPFKDSVSEIQKAYPLTGNGITGGTMSTPEWDLAGAMDKLGEGSEIYRVNLDGTETVIARFGEEKTWEILIPDW